MDAIGSIDGETAAMIYFILGGDSMFEKTKNLCDAFLRLGVPGFDIMVCKDGETVLRHMGGYSDMENRIPVQGNERYNIYSCSKFITCAAAMQLWEKGMFSLEDRLSDYMPVFSQMTVKTDEGIKPAKNPILIKHLFEMTAGFSYDVYSPCLQAFYEETDFRCPTVESINQLAKEPLLFEPGERWNYSLCHDVLAALVEVLSGRKFQDYVKQNIFVPLGMSRSDFLLPKEEQHTIAPQYMFDDERGRAVRHSENYYRPGSEYASGGAGCVSTVEDYMKFLEAMRKGNIILKKDTVALMARNRLTEKQAETYIHAPLHGYGLGIRTPKESGHRKDFGWGGVAGAYLAVDTTNGITLYYSQHLINSPIHPFRYLIYSAVVADILGKDIFPQEMEIYENLIKRARGK